MSWQWLGRFFARCMEIRRLNRLWSKFTPVAFDFEQLICPTASQVSAFRRTSRLYNVKHVILNTKIILKGHTGHSYFDTINFVTQTFSSLLHCGFCSSICNLFNSCSLLIVMTCPGGFLMFLFYKIRPRVWDFLIIWSRGMLADFLKHVKRLRHGPLSLTSSCLASELWSIFPTLTHCSEFLVSFFTSLYPLIPCEKYFSLFPWPTFSLWGFSLFIPELHCSRSSLLWQY